MSIITDAVDKFEEIISGSGCDHGIVSFKEAPDLKICPYVQGRCIKVEYGGKTCEIVTSYPLEVSTKVSFMYKQPLGTAVQRTAACGIINALANFMCFIRLARSCDESSHKDCLCQLKSEIADKKVYLNGTLPGLNEKISDNIVKSPEMADIIIVSGDGLFDDEMLSITEGCRGKKRLIFIGPTTAGFSNISGLEHFCPYGRR
ncbi:MAG: hypothetical protein PHP13_03305 [Methanomicrobium sp.]|nr:hypothetical protein [Methanomicrobium sp.]MDD4299316.1 hypothetical protein [Methanomicrobium sp.]